MFAFVLSRGRSHLELCKCIVDRYEWNCSPQNFRLYTLRVADRVKWVGTILLVGGVCQLGKLIHFTWHHVGRVYCYEVNYVGDGLCNEGGSLAWVCEHDRE
jgi:hypothetical protein